MAFPCHFRKLCKPLFYSWVRCQELGRHSVYPQLLLPVPCLVLISPTSSLHPPWRLISYTLNFPRARVSEEDAQCIRYAEEEKTASESWRNWERSQPKSGRTVGGIWRVFGSESTVHFDAINVQCKVSIWPSACLPLCQTFKTLTEADSDGWTGGVDSDRIQNYDW